VEGRQVAMKVRLQDLAQGTYVRVEGEWQPNFIQTPDGRKFSRVNVIAVIATEPALDMNNSSFVIDDGTARIAVRMFNEISADVKLGDVALIIGRPRQFNQQVYIVPEIIKRIDDKKWVEHRKLELGTPPEVRIEQSQPDNSLDILLKTIQELDKGSGADTEEVVQRCGIAACDTLIDSLLKEGEIFEVSAGRLKVLE